MAYLLQYPHYSLIHVAIVGICKMNTVCKYLFFVILLLISNLVLTWATSTVITDAIINRVSVVQQDMIEYHNRKTQLIVDVCIK